MIPIFKRDSSREVIRRRADWRRRVAFILAAVGLFLVSNALATQTVTLTWDEGPEPDLAGYHLFIGTSSHDYLDMVDVTTGTSAPLTLDDGETYYFAVSAYDTLGQESALAEEISYTASGEISPISPPPAPLPTEQIFTLNLEGSGDGQDWKALVRAPIGTVQRSQFFRTKITRISMPFAPNPLNKLYDVAIEMSSDLSNWTPLVSMLLSSSRSTDFVRMQVVPVPL